MISWRQVTGKIPFRTGFCCRPRLAVEDIELDRSTRRDGNDPYMAAPSHYTVLTTCTRSDLPLPTEHRVPRRRQGNGPEPPILGGISIIAGMAVALFGRSSSPHSALVPESNGQRRQNSCGTVVRARHCPGHRRGRAECFDSCLGLTRMGQVGVQPRLVPVGQCCRRDRRAEYAATGPDPAKPQHSGSRYISRR
jgi:hypothetical protein